MTYSKSSKRYMRVIVLIGLFFSLDQSALAETISGTVFRTSNTVKHTLIDRYAGQTNIKFKKSQQNNNQAIVFLTSAKPQKLKLSGATPQMQQIDKSFKPWLLSVTVGTTVDFPNNDPIFHNVFSYSKTKIFDLGRYRQGKYKSVTFDKTGMVNVFCEIHKEMRAYIMVLDTPFHTVTDKNGFYRLDNVPPGEYTLQVWQENLDQYELKIIINKNENIKLDIR